MGLARITFERGVMIGKVYAIFEIRRRRRNRTLKKQTQQTNDMTEKCEFCSLQYFSFLCPILRTIGFTISVAYAFVCACMCVCGWWPYPFDSCASVCFRNPIYLTANQILYFYPFSSPQTGSSFKSMMDQEKEKIRWYATTRTVTNPNNMWAHECEFELSTVQWIFP